MIGKSFTISSILVSKRSVEAALPTIPPRGLATYWQPAIQEEIGESRKNPGQSGTRRVADPHKSVQAGSVRKSQAGVFIT
jgi:hypothetical protein